MSNVFWTKQGRAVVAKPVHVPTPRLRVSLLIAALILGMVSFVSFTKFDISTYVNLRLLVDTVAVASLISAIALYLRYSVSQQFKRLYLPLLFLLTGVSIFILYPVSAMITTDEATLDLQRMWSLYVLRVDFLLFLLYVIKMETRGIANFFQFIWFAMMSTMIFAISLALIFLYSMPKSVVLGPLLHAEELLPIALSTGALMTALRYGKWRTGHMSFTILLIAEFMLIGSLHLLMRSEFETLELGGFIFFFLAVILPFISILQSMMYAYSHAEQYWAREQILQKSNLKTGGPELSPAIFQQIAKQLNEAFAITDVTGRILFANKHLHEMSGFDDIRLLGNTPLLWQHDSTPQDFYPNIFARIRNTKKMYEGRVKNAYPTNRSKHYEASLRITPVMNEYGEIACCVLQQRSLTTEQEELQLLRQILDTMPLGVLMFQTPTLDVTLGNQQAEILLSRAGLDFRQVKNFSDLSGILKKKDGTVYPLEELPPQKVIATQRRAEASDVCIFAGSEKAPSMIWKMTAVPFYRVDGSLRAILINFDDISKHLEYDHKMTDFVSVASHQLRTPLTSIRWSLDALRKDKGIPEKDKLELFETCYQAAERMMETIKQLLEVAELERGDIKVEAKPTVFTDILKDAISSLKPTIDSKHLVYKESILSTLPLMQMNPFFLNQIVFNLLENAVKYTPENGNLDSIISLKNNRIEWVLHDTGIGIPKGDIDRVFEKFFRSDNAQRSYPNGTGLGLYIVKRTLDLVGGSVHVESEEGHGTTMTVTLPLVQKMGSTPQTTK